MQFLNNILISSVYLAICGCICIVISKLFPSIAGQKIYRSDTLLDLTYWFILSFFIGYITIFLISTLITLYAVLLSPALLAKINTPTNPSLEIAAVILAIVMLDFVAYWLHRIFHSRKLWKFHAIHHSSKEIDWLSSIRFHPVEGAITIGITYTICIVAGIGFRDVSAALLLRGLYGYLVHANVKWTYGPLGYVIASPFFHRWHHTKEKAGIDKNFGGVFSLWDFIFGTAYYPKGIQPHNFGIKDDLEGNFIKHLLYPFK